MKNIGLFLSIGIVLIMIGAFLFIQKNTQLNLNTENPVTSRDANSSSGNKNVSTQGTPSIPTQAPVISQGLPLTITQPVAGATTTAASALIAGKTSPGVAVMINEHELRATTDGSFSLNVALDEGENYFSIVVYDETGKSADTEIMIVRESVQ